MAQLPFGSVQEWFDAVKRRDYDGVVFNLPVYQTTTDNNGETALMYSVRNMDAEMTLLLGPLECGAVNNIGYSALMLNETSCLEWSHFCTTKRIYDCQMEGMH